MWKEGKQGGSIYADKGERVPLTCPNSLVSIAQNRFCKLLRAWFIGIVNVENLLVERRRRRGGGHAYCSSLWRDFEWSETTFNNELAILSSKDPRTYFQSCRESSTFSSTTKLSAGMLPCRSWLIWLSDSITFLRFSWCYVTILYYYLRANKLWGHNTCKFHL
jgi:hypothetical protein